MDRASRQVRSAASKFETREEGNELKIEGYFAVRTDRQRSNHPSREKI